MRHLPFFCLLFYHVYHYIAVRKGNPTYFTVLHCTVLHCTVLYCTALHCTALHCTALHCTVLHCAALHCTALQQIHHLLTQRSGPTLSSKLVLDLASSTFASQVPRGFITYPHTSTSTSTTSSTSTRTMHSSDDHTYHLDLLDPKLRL